MRLLLIDNFDSFVFNLAQAFGAMGVEPIVARNDVPLEDLMALEPDAVLVSPGPGTPEQAGVSIGAIGAFSARVPVFGVCLGHQCIGVAFGGEVRRADVGPVHGKTSRIEHSDEGVFAGLSRPFTATRYHSLSIRDDSLPADLIVTARSTDGTVMGVRHKNLPVEGVQFHPESILTDEGPRLLANFVRQVKDDG